MPTSDDTILRHLKRQARARNANASARVVGIDDWAWRKGSTYGTIVVDLERREVVDVLPIAPRREQRIGSCSIPKSRLSVAIAVAHSLRALAKARLRRVRSPIASISCRTCVKQFRRNSAEPLDQRALCCLRQSVKSGGMR